MRDEIYKKLRKLRQERGLTINNLAEKIGSDYQQLSRIERGKSKLTIDTFLKMAEALETPITNIVTSQTEEKLPACKALNSQETLVLILEKIEILSKDSESVLSPQVKAKIASCLYSQALQLQQIRKDESSVDVFLESTFEVIKLILSELHVKT